MDRSETILIQIKKLAHSLLPNEKVILFGSRARGDAKPYSDWDLLIILNKEKLNFNEDYDNFSWPFRELGFEYGETISAKIFTQKMWDANWFTPFYKNVQAEGILL